MRRDSEDRTQVSCKANASGNYEIDLPDADARLSEHNKGATGESREGQLPSVSAQDTIHSHLSSYPVTGVFGG